MKYIAILIAAIAAIYTGCGESTTGPGYEIILYQQDSLIVSTNDSIKNKHIQALHIGCGLTTPTYFRLTFTAITNDSTNYSKLQYSIISARCQHPPSQQIHLHNIKYGQDINGTYNDLVYIQRTDEYSGYPLINIEFDTNYTNQNKYIKIYNIKFARYSN